ncbi:GDSL esterase/lipase At1g28610-like [Curcuma longa]|uniref:GDSL esterase/lipase At1g28610-like n=1 Tax=Curcuma longa TaxID=136217 RepID=UPI003D9F42EF
MIQEPPPTTDRRPVPPPPRREASPRLIHHAPIPHALARRDERAVQAVDAFPLPAQRSNLDLTGQPTHFCTYHQSTAHSVGMYTISLACRGKEGIGWSHLGRSFRVNNTDIQRYAPLVVHAIGATIDSLIQGRAEAILVSGIYPVGCSPVYLTVYQEDRRNPKTGCIDWLNDLIEYHNRLLQRELERLRRRYPQSKILYADYYGPIMHLYLHPGTFGIEETLVACCGGEGPYNFSVSTPCGSPLSILCSDPSRYVSWDGVHLTEAAHAIVASHILKSFDAKSTPGTISLRQANEANTDVQ